MGGGGMAMFLLWKVGYYQHTMPVKQRKAHLGRRAWFKGMLFI
jgi:hypothetical protein